MMEYLSEISETNLLDMSEKYHHIFIHLDDLINLYSESEESNSDETYSTGKNSHKEKIMSYFRKAIMSSCQELEKKIFELPVIGFNSGKYGLNLIKKDIMAYITEHYNDKEIYTIEKENNYLAFYTSNLRFLVFLMQDDSKRTFPL